MKLNTLIMRALDWPVVMGERLRDWLEAGQEPPKTNPLSRRCYLMSESHLGGHRLIIGFETLEDAQDAHEYVARLSKPPNAGSNGPSA